MRDSCAATPLHCISIAPPSWIDIGRCTELVGLLLGAGASIGAKDNAGSTAMHYASQNGHTQMVAALLEASADVYAEDKASYTNLV